MIVNVIGITFDSLVRACQMRDRLQDFVPDFNRVFFMIYLRTSL
jgi:hypothetical protein